MTGNQLAAAARVAAPLIFAALGAFAVIGWRATAQEDALWAEDRRAAAAAAFNAAKNELSKTVVDYAHWDEAAEHLAARDRGWIAENLGVSAFETFGWSMTAAVAASGEVFALYDHGLAAPTPVAPSLEQSLAGLAARATAAPVGRPLAVVEPVRVGDALLLIGAAAATPTHPEKFPDLVASERATVVMARALDAAALQALGDAYRLPELQDVPPQAEQRRGDDLLLLPIKDSTGLSVGAWAWRFNPPGRRMLLREAPFFIALSLGIGAVGWAASRRLARLAGDRAEMIRKLRVARRDAAAADRAKAQFLSVVSHELFTPLNGVLGFAELIRLDQAADRDQINHYADVVLERAQRLHGLISDVIAAATLDPLAPPQLDAHVDLTEMVSDVAQALNGQALERQITLTCAAKPRLWAQANADLLRQALIRLVENAVHWSPTGESVRLSVAGALEHPSILIEDHGPGLSPAVLSAFDAPFSFDGAALHRGEEGLGLNLFLAHGLVTASGGALTVAARGGGPGLIVTLALRPSLTAAGP